ncbi:MAG TPA: MucB/RseB C-terminal domain-containing protein [Steroidobacteraceae bacterium]|jgi:sigma-E factor negative regulatory protein RseB|nr:MucB/RseB C-terminal domain-containing protein [Steroidobacteraceae bacterium]
MIRSPPNRANWLVSCAIAGALLAALPQRSHGADEPRDWLEKMNQALATRNYDGTFFHLSEGRVETMRIVHRVRAGRVTERLQSLDGSGREFVRNNDQLTCYLPDQHTVLVEPRQDRGPFLGSLPKFDASVNDFYRIEALPATHILGRPARAIAVNPKDQFRFGYRLWLDEKTAMPLKTQLCDSHGRVIEQIFFARLDMPENIPDSDLAPTVRTEGMRWVRQGAHQDSASPALSAFRASELPPGFRLTVSGAQTLGDAAEPASHLVYSDGLATVSVFVEAPRESTAGALASSAAAPPEPPMVGLHRVGSGYAFSTIVQDHQVTAVGEVPAATVEFIARSVKISGGGELPRH